VRSAVIAVLTGPQPVDGDGLLRSTLTGLGITVITADGPAATARAVASASAAGAVALVDPRLAAHPHALRLALLDPRWEAAHAPGMLTVAGAARELLAAELRAMPDLTAHRVDGTSPAARLTAPRPLLADEFAELLRVKGVVVHETALPDGLVARLVEEPLAARKAVYTEIAAVSDEAIRLRGAVKGDEGPFTTYCVSSWTPLLARWCARRGWSPNLVTTLSLLIALAGAGAAATGTRAGYVCAAFAVYLAFALDRTDGQLARYALHFSRLGSWLDADFDRIKEYAVYAGLALGAVRGGHDRGVWLLAAAAMVLQTLRHHIDFAYRESLRGQPSAGAPAAGTAAADGVPARSSSSAFASSWLRKLSVLPIGERWALIALLTALTTPRIVFSVLLIWGLLAAVYTTTRQVRQSLRGNGIHSQQAVNALRAMCDLPLAIKAAASEPLIARLGWLAPPTIQLVAYVVVLGLIVDDALLGAASFALLAAVIYHHYDVVYRIRANASQPPHWFSVALGGNLGRSVLVVVLGTAITSDHTLSTLIWLLAAYLGVLAVGDSIRFWTRPGAPVLPE
jgi:phosphatidylglycerophosphate synthase